MADQPTKPQDSAFDRAREIVDAAAEMTADVAPDVPAADYQAHPFPTIANYEILECLGRGGQAEVFKALFHKTLLRAVKVFFKQHVDEESVHKTAAILNNLSEDSRIVGINDIGHTEDGRLYLGTQYVAGRTLDKFLHDTLEGKHLEPKWLLALFHEIAEAVAFAHTKNITHCDLKPSNIIIDHQGKPHVLDFDAARTGTARPMDISLSSFPWLAPEQAANQPELISTRTDVYSLGVVLYYIITGCRFPYAHLENMGEALICISRGQVIPPSERIRQKHSPVERPAFPPLQAPINDDVEWIVLKALRHNKNQQYRTAGELSDDVAKYLGGNE